MRYGHILVLSVIMLCSACGSALANDSEADVSEYEHLFPEPPENGIPFGLIEDIDYDELAELVSEVTEYHYGFSCTEFDTIPLMAPDGEYRALVAFFSTDPELDNTYEYFLDILQREIELHHIYESSYNVDVYEYEAVNRERIEYTNMRTTYKGIIMALINNNLTPVGVADHASFGAGLDSLYLNEEMRFLGFGILPIWAPSFEQCKAYNRYMICPITEKDNGSIEWRLVPERAVKEYGWLLYLDDFKWADWVIRNRYGAND